MITLRSASAPPMVLFAASWMPLALPLMRLFFTTRALPLLGSPQMALPPYTQFVMRMPTTVNVPPYRKPRRPQPPPAEKPSIWIRAFPFQPVAEVFTEYPVRDAPSRVGLYGKELKAHEKSGR